MTRSRALIWLVFGTLGIGCQCGSHPGGATSGGGNGSTGAGNTTSGGSNGGGSTGAVQGCGLRTCASLNANCGQIGDGCGHIIPCGDLGGGCPAGETCGGGGTPLVCGGVVSTGGDAGCTDLCLLETSCGDGGTTTLTGTVHAPTNANNGFGDPDPLPNVLVYIPNGVVEPFTAGVSCEACGAPVTGSPLVSTLTATNGTFSLQNVPIVPGDAGIPLVIQAGRWRRQVVVPPVTACTTTPIADNLTRFPRNQAEGDIPEIAMVTGNVDSIECVLRKMGIDDSEFTAPGPDAGRVQMYVAANGNDLGATDPTQTAPAMGTLTSNAGTLSNYDLVVFACVGGQVDQAGGDKTKLLDYANAGGRIYASHYSYVWLYDNGSFAQSADWHVDVGPQVAQGEAEVDTTFQRGDLFDDWLDDVGALDLANGYMPLNAIRHDFNGSVAPAQTWLYYDGGMGGGGRGANGAFWPVHYTFNTPFEAGADAGLCGRVVFSDFHIENQSQNSNQETFPNECTASPMTPQEKVVEFMLFDLASCVIGQTQQTTNCTPLTCDQQGYDCGPAEDGCGHILECGVCDAGSCGGAGQANVCGTSLLK